MLELQSNTVIVMQHIQAFEPTARACRHCKLKTALAIAAAEEELFQRLRESACSGLC